jgi:uncharacterized membrane protein YuzA (DUF378 family)
MIYSLYVHIFGHMILLTRCIYFLIILLNVICGLTSTKIQTFTHNALVHCPDQYNEIVTYHMLNSTMLFVQL